jgi:tetratricopeptide (TPR) repeat protein
VDNLDGKSQTTAEQARAFLTKTGHKGTAGFASNETVQTLDHLLREAVYRHLRMPVPASFLVDKGGWLTVIYKGKVETARIAEDLKDIAVNEDRARELAVPFAGPWASRASFVSHLPAVVAAWRESGDTDSAKETLLAFLKDNPPKPGDTKLAAQLADVQFRLGDLALEANDAANALESFNAALAANPQIIPAQLGRLRALSQLKQEDALSEGVQRLMTSPAAADALAIMAAHHRRAGQWKEAAVQLRQATLKNPRFVPGLNELALILAAAPDAPVRNPGEALSIANFFLQAPGARQNPEFLLTLAAAHAAKGEFPAAIAATEEALSLARAKSDRDFLHRATRLLDSFRASRPWLLDVEN